MQNNNFEDLNYQKKLKEYQKNIEKLFDREKYRKEKHDSTRIIFNREISPVQMYQNVMNNTTFIYKNRALEEGRKVIYRLKGIRGRRNFGIVIQWIGFLMLLISSYIIFGDNLNIKEWEENTKIIVAFSFLFGLFIFPVVGGIIRGSGKKPMADYVYIANPIEINRLLNGQLVIIHYSNKNKSCDKYLSALNSDDTIWNQNKPDNLFSRSVIPTYIDYMYIIDSVKSYEVTQNGIMIESSGRFYGERGAYSTHSNDSKSVCYYVFAESHISYRKEVIPEIFENMNQLEALLINYKDYQVGRDAFVPYGSGINIQG